MITVQISHPDGTRQEILLAGVPRVGEGIKLRNHTPNGIALVVDYVMWTEGGPRGQDPQVIAVVKHVPRIPDV